MSAIQIEISEEDFSFLSQVAEKRRCTIPEAAEEVIAQAADSQKQLDYLEMRAARGKKITEEQWREIMEKVPDAPPVPGDELPEGWEAKADKH